MSRKFKFGLVAVSLISLTSSSAFSEEPTQDSQIWVNVVFNGHLSQRLSFTGEINPRFQDISRKKNLRSLGFGLVRGGLGFDVTKNFQVGGGFTWARNFNSDPGKDDELRIHQDLVFHIQSKNKRVTMSVRNRFEERFFDRDASAKAGLRVRDMISLSFLLHQWKAKNGGVDRNMSFDLGDEFWWIPFDTPGSPQAGFDQNWAFGGLGFKVNPHFTLGFRYMAVVKNNHGEKPIEVDHVLMVIPSAKF